MLLPCPVGSPPALLGCGRWTQPWADSDTQTEPQEGGAPVGGVSSPVACPGAAAGLRVANMDFSRGALTRTAALTIGSVCVPGNREPSMSVTHQGIRVTSEASDGQSAMEMVILYCVSLQGRGKALVWRFPLL